MDRKNNYQRIEFLTSSDEQEDDGFKFEEDGLETIGEQENELYTPSPQSSSPPRDFNINIESQYIPLYDEDASPDPDIIPQSSSLASSLSIESNHDYTTSPIILSPPSCRIIRCPVCEKPMRTFYCAKCIQRGHFVTLDSQITDRFSDTKIKLFDEEIQTDTLHEPVDEKRHLEDLLQVKLRTLSKKTEALKSLLDDQKMKLEETVKLLKETQTQLDLQKNSNKSKKSKIELMKKYITSRKASIKKRKDSENLLLDELKQIVSRRVYQLTSDVFPIEEVNLLEHNNSFVNMETSPLLTFSDGSYHQIENQTAFSIVEPWLPSNGDYSAYSLWVNDNQDQIPASVSELSERNPAFRIGAGLSYTTQLVKNLASYLDVILPAKLEQDSFDRKLLNDVQFTYNVAKLNSNVIHLCISQGIDASLLHPQRTLKNLLLLFNMNICDLGRKPIIELVDNEEVANKLVEQLASDLSLVQDDFYDFSKFADDDNVSDSDWEISDTINPMEMQLATEQSIQQNSYISRLPIRLLASFFGSSS